MVTNVDDLERYGKDQDLIFQELEEKARLKEQATDSEFAVRMQARLKAAHVSVNEWARMVESGRTSTEINDFLEAKILDVEVESYVMLRRSQGKPPISAEKARALILRLRSEE